MLAERVPPLYGVLVAKATSSVVPDPDREGKYALLCPSCEFVSTGWPTRKAAAERGDQHAAEHDSGDAMPELAESGIPGAVQE